MCGCGWECMSVSTCMQESSKLRRGTGSRAVRVTDGCEPPHAGNWILVLWTPEPSLLHFTWVTLILFGHLFCPSPLLMKLGNSCTDKSASATAWTVGRSHRVQKVSSAAHRGASVRLKVGLFLFSFRFYTCDLPTHLSYGRSTDGFKTVGDFSYYVERFQL